ncbi:MAG TPA: bacteriocin [Ktedonobacterales bacterium]|jgi:bacteriocin-like protein
MANNDKQNEKQPTTQAELSDEELKQVVGGFEPSITAQDDGTSPDGADIQKKWLPAN